MLAFQTTNMPLTRVFIRTVHGRGAFDTSPRITGHVYTTAARAQFLFFSLYGRPPPALRVSVKRRVNPAAVAAAGPLVSLTRSLPFTALLRPPRSCCHPVVRRRCARAVAQGTSPFIFSAAACLDKWAFETKTVEQRRRGGGSLSPPPPRSTSTPRTHTTHPHTPRPRIREASAFPRQPLPFPRHAPLPPLRGLFFMPCTTRHTILPRPAPVAQPPILHPPPPPRPSLGSRGPPVLIHKGPLSLITIVAATAAGVLCCRLDTPRKLYGGSKKHGTRGRHPRHRHIGRAIYNNAKRTTPPPPLSTYAPPPRVAGPRIYHVK